MDQPKVWPTGARVAVALVLGLLGFVFPLLFVPAALILWSVFQDQKAPTQNGQVPADMGHGAKGLKQRSAEITFSAKVETAKPTSGRLGNSAPPRQVDKRAETALMESLITKSRPPAGSQIITSAPITPEEFLRRFGITSFYHFTDTRNLASIGAHGGLLPWSRVKGKVVAPGGNDWSHDADAIKGQDQYVHLCFLPEHPMEFAAKRDGRIVESRFLRIDPSIIHTSGILFSSDVANKSGIPTLGLAEAVAKMDFEIIATAHKKWLDPPLFERKKIACKYEMLVPCKIPLSLISGF